MCPVLRQAIVFAVVFVYSCGGGVLSVFYTLYYNRSCCDCVKKVAFIDDFFE